MITKELVEQFVSDSGMSALIECRPGWASKLADFAQRAAAYAVTQREAELRKLIELPEPDFRCLSDVQSGIDEWYRPSTVKRLIAAAKLQGMEAGREQAIDQVRHFRRIRDERDANAKRIIELERINQGLPDALEYVDSENASEEVLRRACAAIAAVEKENTK